MRHARPVACSPVLEGEFTWVPGELPRRGVFARWGTGSGSAKVELVFPGGTYGIRKRLISAEFIPLRQALPALMSAGGDGPSSAACLRRSVLVWAAAAAAGGGLGARGRLLPTVGDGGTEIWRAGPFDPAGPGRVHRGAGRRGTAHPGPARPVLRRPGRA